MNLSLTKKGRTVVDITGSYSDSYEKTGADGLGSKQSVDVQEQSLYLKLSRGINDTTSLDLTMPYRAMEVKELDYDETGIGDLELILNHQIKTAIPAMFWLSAGVMAPTGDYDAKDGFGTTANTTLQMGRGEWAAVAGLSCLTIPKEGLTVYGDLRTRINLGHNSDGYRYGTSIDTTLGASYDLGSFDLFSDLFWSHSADDEKNGNDITDSGGNMYFLSPGARYWINDRTAASFKVQFLLDEDAGGEQMLPKEIYSLTFTVLLGQ